MSDASPGDIDGRALVSACCGSGVKRSFYGRRICAACRSELDATFSGTESAREEVPDDE